MMKKVVKLDKPFARIPCAIIWEILGRVPIKTCLACKLVCKEWYRVVANPDFSSFRSHCVASRITLMFYNGWVGGEGIVFRLVELETTSNFDDSGNCIVGSEDLVEVRPKIDIQRFYALSHCNGVVCLESIMREYFVCNLLTSECVNVQNLHKLNKCYTIIGCELGCCPVTRQFKVLMFLRDKEGLIVRAKIQTLGDGEWRSLGIAPLRGPRNGCFLNGSSYWCGRTYIWSFHFGKEKFLRFPIPNDIINASYKKREKKLIVLNSSLSLGCCCYENGGVTMDVWIMKEYGVKESWVKQFVIKTNEFLWPLVQMDKEKILIRNTIKLYLCDLQTQVSKRVTLDLNELSDRMMSFTAIDARFFKF